MVVIVIEITAKTKLMMDRAVSEGLDSVVKIVYIDVGLGRERRR